MNHISDLRAFAGLFITLAAAPLWALDPLIVVGDRGGDPALPYYQSLNPQEARKDKAASLASGIPRIPHLPDAEAALLPVRSEWLSPGEEPPRAIHAPGLRPIFIIGDDERSHVWLRQRTAVLRDLRAVGLVVNVSSPESLAALRRLVPGLSLSPVSGDDLARRLGLRHYPVLMTATGIEP
jgi:integrating conjugative element protein (TIGR03765 family)